MGRTAEAMLVGSSRSLKKRVAAEGWGTLRVAPVKPSGMEMGLEKSGFAETAWRRKKLRPVTVQGKAVSAGH